MPLTRRTLESSLLCAGLTALIACSGAGDPETGTRMAGSAAGVAGAGGGFGTGAGASGGAAGAGGFGNSDMPPQQTPPIVVDTGNDGESCAAVTQMAESRKQPADIIWAIDTSSSMVAARDAIVSELNAFSQRITDAGIDAHIILLGSTDPNFCFGPSLDLCIAPPLGSGQCGGGTLGIAPTPGVLCAAAPVAGAGLDSTENFLHLNAASGASMQLSTILAQYPAYASMLRPDARKQLVITGDGDAEQAFAQFQQALAALDPSFAPGQWQMNGVYCREACLPTCPAPAPGYTDFVQQSGGVAGSLCDGAAGFQAVIDELATAVIVGAQLSCEWELPPPPTGESFDKNKVNVAYTGGSGVPTPYGKLPPGTACGDLDGWYYDSEDAPTKVLVCPKTCEALQAEPSGRLDIALGCETQLVQVD